MFGVQVPALAQHADARVVEHEVETSVLRDDAVEHTDHVAFDGDIDPFSLRSAPALENTGDHALGPFEIARRHHHDGAPVRQRVTQGTSDSRGAAGDDRHLARELTCESTIPSHRDHLRESG